MGQEKSFKIENGLFVKQDSEFLENVDILGNLNIGGSASFSNLEEYITESSASSTYLTKNLDILTISDTSEYTLELSDANSVIEMNSSGSNVLTIPANSTVPFDIGTSFDVVQIGEGQTTISFVEDVSVNSKDSNNKISSQYGAATLYKRGTNEWILIGDLTS